MRTVPLALVASFLLLPACGNAAHGPVSGEGSDVPPRTGGTARGGEDRGSGAGQTDEADQAPDAATVSADAGESFCARLGVCCAGMGPGDTSAAYCSDIVFGGAELLCRRRFNALRANQQCL